MDGKRLTYDEKKKLFLEDEINRLDVMNIEKVREVYYFIKEFNYNLFQKLELYNFEEFIKNYSSIYETEEYIESSDSDDDLDDY